jgi:hypothetical protein
VMAEHGELPPELAPAQAPVTQGQQSMTPAADAMRPGIEDAMGEFITFLVGLMESKGFDLDEVMGEPSAQDELDVVEGGLAEMDQFLSEEDLLNIATRFVALPPEQQQQLKQEVFSGLPPEMQKRLEAVERFARQRMGRN